MTVEKIGLVTFALVFLFGFAWRASVQRHFYYMRWLDLVDMVNPAVEEVVFEKRVSRFGRILACMSVVSLLAAMGSVYWIKIEYGRLQELNGERLGGMDEVGSLEMAMEKHRVERKRQMEELLSRYVAKVDVRIREMAKENDFASLVEMNQERTYGLAIAKEVGNDVGKVLGMVDEVKLPPLALLEVTTHGERLELRRSLTRAVGTLYEETGVAFLEGVEHGEAERGGAEAVQRVRAEWLAEEGRYGPPEGIFVGQPDLARTLLLPLR